MHYKADITSPLKDLKQGFTVTVEVLDYNKHQIVPVTSIFKTSKKDYVWVYDDSTSKVKMREVHLGKQMPRSKKF